MEVHSSLTSQAMILPSSGRASCNRERAVAGEHADLEGPPRVQQVHEQCHKLALESGEICMLACGCLAVSFAQPLQERWLSQGDFRRM